MRGKTLVANSRPASVFKSDWLRKRRELLDQSQSWVTQNQKGQEKLSTLNWKLLQSNRRKFSTSAKKNQNKTISDCRNWDEELLIVAGEFSDPQCVTNTLIDH